MKTLREFIQRLQDDPAFEKKAQTFVAGDELMDFVKSEGYNFTLEQLTSAFKQRAKLPAEAGGMAPPDLRASTPPRPVDPAFAGKPDAIPPREQSAALPKSGSGDFTEGQSAPGLPKPKGEMPSQGTGESPRVGGGRHRGFSSQKLKSAKDP